ncbi:hypothetical protein B0A50_07281 [Salinomyces thailandicus]|uniref:Uncharacterized protein n=1 Tax=Salinomyces thailandicus TaxID=706561 RepID=A0A4U0TNS7_9PEZI|nr:hypothetical protein B0A50_07281 [Salinomyces thailandica]
MSAHTSLENGTSLPALGLFTDQLETAPLKYDMMRQNLQKDRDIYSEPASPTAGGRSFGTTMQRSAGARALARSSRQSSSMSRRTSFIQGHRQKMSEEHFAQAERSFMSLMELMMGASKEAGTLKEYWSRLMGDRESFEKERESLMVQIEEVTASMSQMELEQENQRRHVGDRKQEVARLLTELSTHAATILELRKRLTDREASSQHTHTEITEIRTSLVRAHSDYEKLQALLEGAQSKLRTTEEELLHAREEAEKYRNDYRALTRELADLKSRNGDLAASLDASRNEVHILTERTRAWELEKASLLAEKDRMQFEVRKHVTKTDDLSRELAEVNEKFTRLQRELHHSKETLRTTELDRDEHASSADAFRRELKDRSLALDKVELQHSELLVRLEQESRKVISKDETLIEKDTQLTGLQQRLNSKQDETRQVIIERDQLRDDYDREHQLVHDHRLKLTSLEERVVKAEARLTDARSEAFTTTELIRTLERERDDAREKHTDTTSETRALNERILRLQEDLRAATHARDHTLTELEAFKTKYEEVSETITEWQDDTGEYEYEIENLRVLLRESREQKEAAISARNAADQERDRSISMYEEKCREFERLAESSSRASFSRSQSIAHGHGHGHGHSSGGERSSSVRIYSKGSTMTGDSHKEGNGEGNGESVLVA